MFYVLDELRDLLEANLRTSNTAASGTTTTNIKIVGHGKRIGDIIINSSRADARRLVTAVVDADNFTVASVTGQTSGDTILFPKFNKFYVGNLNKPPMGDLPVLMVYGKSTEMPRSTTATDKYAFGIEIKIMTNAYAKVATAEDVDKVLRAQKEIWDLMEERDPTTGIPLSTSILGVLRRNITGTKYLYNNNIEIAYDERPVGNSIYYSGIMSLYAVTQFKLRS